MSVKSWPTWKIKEVLEHPYYQGIDGKDYEPIKDELQEELWRRQEKQDLIDHNKAIAECILNSTIWEHGPIWGEEVEE